MSASALLGCLIKPGRQEEARAVLRGYANHLVEHFGGSVTAHQILYGGELQGRILVSWNHADTASRAAALERARVHGTADNPYVEAINAPDPVVTTYNRSLLRSVASDEPALPQTALRLARGFTAGPGKRAEAEAALSASAGRARELGVQSSGLIMEDAGPVSDAYFFTVSFDSWTALEDYQRGNAELGPVPSGIAALLASGALTSLSRRIDYGYDLG